MMLLGLGLLLNPGTMVFVLAGADFKLFRDGRGKVSSIMGVERWADADSISLFYPKLFRDGKGEASSIVGFEAVGKGWSKSSWEIAPHLINESGECIKYTLHGSLVLFVLTCLHLVVLSWLCYLKSDPPLFVLRRSACAWLNLLG